MQKKDISNRLGLARRGGDMNARGSGSDIDVHQNARDLAKEVAERAEEIESNRRLPADLSRQFAAAGFYRMCVPEAYGGLELPPAETMEAIEILARADGASGWCVFIGSTSGAVLSMLPEDAAREVFATPETLVSGVFAPLGTANAMEGGFQVDGRWQWGSGTQNADWVYGGCKVIRDGEMEFLHNGVPRSRLMLVPASAVEFLDTWYVSGLEGTGSTDFLIRDVFVPESHAAFFGVDPPLERPLYIFPQFGLLGGGIAAVALGLARAAIDEVNAFAGGKTPTGSARALALRASAQIDVSRAEATLRSARAFFYEAIDDAWQSAVTRGVIEIAHRRDIRLATTHATRAAADAVDLMYNLAGGTALYRSSPLQRIFRDVHAVTQHMMVSPASLELTGRLLFGLETDTSML